MPGEHWFLSMCHARAIVADWPLEYNEVRSHSALDYQTLKEFVERFLTAGSKLVSDQIRKQVRRGGQQKGVAGNHL